MLEKLNQLTEGHGALKPGHGLISGIIALCLGILCFLGVLVFHFPQYLTTPQLRQSYNVDVAKSDKIWPQKYGVLGDYVPNGFVKQFKFPFAWKG